MDSATTLKVEGVSDAHGMHELTMHSVIVTMYPAITPLKVEGV
jgi:hypothetical protein